MRYTAKMFKRIPGILVRGHRVASAPSKDYPYSALEKQKPYFKALGLDLGGYFTGTLNISIAPLTFEMTKPEFTFPLLEWTDLHPPETFSFSRCQVFFNRIAYDGWVYFPHPETKIRHRQNPSLIEVIAEFIPGIHYGDSLEAGLNLDEVTVRAG